MLRQQGTGPHHGETPLVLTPPPLARRRLLRVLPLAICLLSLLAFLPALQAGFVNWDDTANLLNNPHFRGLGWTQLTWMFTTTLMGHYIPLTWLSLGVNYALGGMEPRGYHLGNLLLHAANAGLFYLVARRLLAAGFATRAESVAWGAAVSALVFGVHPLRAESVAWVTERRDVLCGLFYLLAVLAYLRGVEGGGRIRRRWRALSCLAFGAALLSKAMAMTLPATLLLLDLYPLRRTGLGWKALLREKAPYAGLGLLGAAAAVVALSRGATVTGYGEYGLAARVALVGYTPWFYPRAMLWPVGLSPLYEIPGWVNPVEWRFLGPMVAVALTTAILVALRRRWPAGLAAWAHSAIVLLPVSGIVHAGYQLAHDRYSYLSGLGFALLAGAALVWTAGAARAGRVAPWVPRALAVAAALAVLGWGAGAWRQTRIWQSSESLWQAALAADPECALCNNNMGAAIVRSRQAGPAPLRLAEAHFRYAILLRPERADPYHNLGALLAGQKRYHEAEWALRTYMRLSPAAPDGPLRLGMLYADQGRYAEAIESLDRALQLRAEYPEARAERGRALSALRETDPARAEPLTHRR
ncbi:MAG: hypothetical protein A2X52_04375 [Candidatus Rokubacteria bacterium GWC2_70_16]|nr:MAG: hypothetical protein A2X52_04375 [Candidatus Rokubacteria bacterium GWC2_70_16]OGL14023.1 MAG: hypothetical protein A3K12_09960 [Candidatus Rokubacteria bacterium RIFCSPLOWO2_12_FULL_71_19]